MKYSTVVDDSSDEEYKKTKCIIKSQKNPTTYNIFIAEQIQRIKLENPDILPKDRMKIAQQLWRDRK